MKQFVKHRTFENKKFLSDVASLVSVNLNELVENRDYAIKQKRKLYFEANGDA